MQHIMKINHADTKAITADEYHELEQWSERQMFKH